MRKLCIFLALILFMAGCGNEISPSSQSEQAQTDGVVRLYPGNPRYLEYQGEPVILITSAEHYGAVVNLDFDFSSYLQTLHTEGFNYTRIFAGTYIEPFDNIFGIQDNTLGPGPDRYIAPWVREDGKYKLDRFNPAFFERLRSFVSQAEQLGIIVEITLFTSIYANNSWELMPFHPDNNMNHTGVRDYHRVNTLYNGSLKKYQEELIRKLVRELNDFGNIFYEIQNEPWSDNANLVSFVNEEDKEVFTRPWQKRVEIANGVSLEWQKWVAGVITDEENSLESKHLIAQNISNFKHKQENLPPGISIINFHYALPDAVLINLDLGGVIGLDETGFMPQEDLVYIKQAWRFILSGGGLYNNLDYSFTAEHETGTWPIGESNPGWGGPGFRKKLSYLVRAMDEIPFYDMKPVRQVFKATEEEMQQYALYKEGEIYLVFLEQMGANSLIPDIPAGTYDCTWLHVETGEQKTEQLELGANVSVSSPYNSQEVVIKIEKVK
jgi:hypothetical protein